MLCQNCQKNEADKVFVASWMGQQYQMHICSECLERMWRYAAASGFGESFHAYTGWQPGQGDPRESGHSPFPAQAEPAIKLRLRLNALRYRLEEAARREDYEEAARLRDSIAAIKQEEYSHES